MLFNSLAFAIFIPIVFALCWAAPRRFRWAVLLAVSYWFCANLDLRYALILLATTVLSYFIGRWMGAARTAARRRAAVAVGVTLLAAELGFFKYTNFILEAWNEAAARFSWSVHAPTLKILLPVGISFYVFQTIGYLVDVYRGKIQAERHFGYYALFVSFFPALTSGPIGRAGELLSQYKNPRPFDAARASYGLKLLAWGYFKKLVIADTLAVTVNQIYNHLDSYAGLVLLVAAVLYAIEIYCDFSGYSDVAVGVGKLLGVELTVNFKSPYFAHSVREFWGRWHVSLSTWLRDYIYIPLGGSRCGRARHIFNLFVTFLVSGLWHGANWTFLVWGALHGLYQSAETLLRPRKREGAAVSGAAVGTSGAVASGAAVGISGAASSGVAMGTSGAASSGAALGTVSGKNVPALRALQILATFAAVTFAWIFFRAASLSDAWYVISHILYGIENFVNYLKVCVISLNMDYWEMAWTALPIVFLAVVDYLSQRRDMILVTRAWKPWVKYPLYMLFAAAVLVGAEKGVATEFIYSAF